MLQDARIRTRFGSCSLEKSEVSILKQAEAGRKEGRRPLYREQGITEQTFYRWRAGGLEVSQAHELNRVLDETTVSSSWWPT